APAERVSTPQRRELIAARGRHMIRAPVLESKTEPFVPLGSRTRPAPPSREAPPAGPRRKEPRAPDEGAKVGARGPDPRRKGTDTSGAADRRASPPDADALARPFRLSERKGFSLFGARKTEREAMASKRITVPGILEASARGDRLVMVTAYDFPQGKTADAAGADLILVGDSLAMVVLGHPDTLAVTLDEMIHHTRAVRRGVERALLVADMPYGSFHLGPDQAVASAIRFVKEAGAQAVKIEGGRPEVVRALDRAEVPVMAHLGLTPQSVHRLGGFKVQGRSEGAAQKIFDAALELEDAGAFSLVLECVPSDLAAEITDRLAIPTIGIGAGAACDGQVL